MYDIILFLDDCVKLQIANILRLKNYLLDNLDLDFNTFKTPQCIIQQSINI